MKRRTILAAIPAALAISLIPASFAEAHKDDLFPGLTKALRRFGKQQRKAAK